MTDWVFVRHAQSVANRDGWLAGQVDAPLTDGGRAEAAAVRLDDRFDRAWSSDLSRAGDTARILLGNAGPAVTPLSVLRERHLGAWECDRLKDCRADGRLATLLRWDGTPPGGESLRDCAARMIGWLATVPDGGPSLVVAHGAVLRATLGALDGLPRENIGLWAWRNVQVERRRVDQARWRALLTEI